MPFQYTTRKGKVVYLHQGQTKSGTSKYFFSPLAEGCLLDTLPDGYEVYENPNSQVFVRKCQPQIIRRDEELLIREVMERHSRVKPFQVDVKKNAIYVYLPDQDVDALKALLSTAAGNRVGLTGLLETSVTYSPVLSFELADPETREFGVSRRCFRGAMPEWIPVGVGSLADVASEFLPYLGTDAFFELF
jgi:hypothetical protein